jgi:hypothetical protein
MTKGTGIILKKNPNNDDSHRSRPRRRRLLAKLESRKRRSQKLENISNASFLHVGKAGGGFVQKRIVWLGFNFFYEHPNPVKHRKQIQTYLINLRDPIDRFLSNFYWSGLILCHNPKENANEHETRSPLKHALHLVEREPHVYCRNTGASTEAEAALIHNSYGGDAEQLANALCDNNNEGVRERALEDMRKMAHAKHSISDWLSSLANDGNDNDNDNNNNNGASDATMVGMVLEAGHDFQTQIESALAFALAKKYGYAETEETVQTQQIQTALTIVGENAIAWEIKQKENKKNKDQKKNINATKEEEDEASSPKLHSSRPPDEVLLPPWVERMQAHRTKGISDRAACCLASTFYKEDYSKWLVLLDDNTNANGTVATMTTPLGELVCNGPAEGMCKAALVSIAKRHSGRNCGTTTTTIEPEIIQGGAFESESPFFGVEHAPVLAFDRTVLLTFQHTMLCLVALGVMRVMYNNRHRMIRKMATQ